MHTINRVITVTILLLLLIPAGTSAFLAFGERQAAADNLSNAIDDAAASYRQRGGAAAMRTKAQEERDALAQQVQELLQEKLVARRKLVTVVKQIRRIEYTYDISLASPETFAPVLAIAEEETAEALRVQYRAEQTGKNEAVISIDRLSPLLHASVASGAITKRTDASALTMRLAMLKDLHGASPLLEERADLAAKREEVLTRYWVAQRAYDEADRKVVDSEEKLDQIKAIMADVHDQVLALQGELARIDARLRRKAERALLEKGLIDAEQIGRGRALAGVGFSWPVYGRISAGFFNKAYEGVFGVPHHGADIVVPQGTPVGAASDGIVFLVREGGAKGYTYVLIGHRDGYATLYGHLSVVSVTAGQEVDAGQTIGLSGGKPGTVGAGPMTTAPHLHFEVIKNGVNVDPESVLP